jgi:hypothetical protein
VAAICALVGTPAFWLAAAAVVLAGLVRGFAGFGSAMIMMPSLSALYQPTVAVPTGLLLEILLTVPFTATAAPMVDWRRLSVITVAATLAVPAGALALAVAPPLYLRWCISLAVLLFVAVLAAGWRYRGRPTLGATAAAGAASGLLNGSVGMAGPPVLLFLLAGPYEAAQVRATCIAYFGLIDAITLFALGVGGVVGGDALLLATALAPLYLAAAGIGARVFGRTGGQRYRPIALVILALVAFGSLVPQPS